MDLTHATALVRHEFRVLNALSSPLSASLNAVLHETLSTSAASCRVMILPTGLLPCVASMLCMPFRGFTWPEG
mgnify:CR=1 FL=1